MTTPQITLKVLDNLESIEANKITPIHGFNFIRVVTQNGEPQIIVKKQGQHNNALFVPFVKDDATLEQINQFIKNHP